MVIDDLVNETHGVILKSGALIFVSKQVAQRLYDEFGDSVRDGVIDADTVVDKGALVGDLLRQGVIISDFNRYQEQAWTCVAQNPTSLRQYFDPLVLGTIPRLRQAPFRIAKDPSPKLIEPFVYN